MLLYAGALPTMLASYDLCHRVTEGGMWMVSFYREGES
jgi:hypothetical protein